MNIWSALYRLLIGPLELFFEVVFSIANRFLGHSGFAIIFLSLAMNFLVLPLYRRADMLQAEQRNQEAKMEKWVMHIKKTFKGDERFMMLQTYYRQNSYKPTYALKGSVSLLLEIPFFIAAYRFLSNLEILQGVSFGPIRDLGLPDGLINIAGISVNALPILMTLINIISAAIYMHGFPLKSKLQMYAMALIFLVFLYASPSGLVFYWTLNNVFSLVKNIFYKLKNPSLVLSVCSSATGMALLYLVLFAVSIEPMLKKVMLITLLLALQLPLIFYFLRKRVSPLKEISEEKGHIFILSCLFLSVLTGILIPTAIIKSSVSEFIDLASIKSPLWYVFNSTLMSAGTFLVWFGMFYKLAAPQGKKLMSGALFALSGAAAVDFMFFGTEYGNISSLLKYDRALRTTGSQILINLVVILTIILVLFILWKLKRDISSVLCTAMCVAVITMSFLNIRSIQLETEQIKINSESTSDMQSGGIPQFSLSKNGKNVVVMMLDRAYGGFVPFVMQEKPELLESFDGFTYYPNTLSFGHNTYSASSALYGGYEYTPVHKNTSEKSWNEYQNEALCMMPRLFSENGFNASVIDPPLVNGNLYTDTSIYKEYPKISAYATTGQFSLGEGNHAEMKDRILNRNLFCYSLFRISPVLCHLTFYNQGLYNEARESTSSMAIQVLSGISSAYGIDNEFMNAYASLENLSLMTKVTDSASGGFLLFSNETTHDNRLLQKPDYVPSVYVDNSEFDSVHPEMVSTDGRTIYTEDEVLITHYHSFVAAFQQVSEWLDYLKENNVYDNTKIIIVSDHGYIFDDAAVFGTDDRFYAGSSIYNPVLMVKDYDSKGFRTDELFMTNADVPTLAFEGVINEPINPFTGHPVDSSEKNDALQIISVYDKNDWNKTVSGYIVHGGNIFNIDNWVRFDQ